MLLLLKSCWMESWTSSTRLQRVARALAPAELDGGDTYVGS